MIGEKQISQSALNKMSNTNNREMMLLVAQEQKISGIFKFW